MITMKDFYKEKRQKKKIIMKKSRDCTRLSSTKLLEFKGKHPKAPAALTRGMTQLPTKEPAMEIACSTADVRARLFLRLLELNQRL